MKILPYILFNGNCREAVSFYAEVFGSPNADVITNKEIVSNAESEIEKDDKQFVMHSKRIINEANVMFSDLVPGMAFIEGNNVTLIIISDEMEEIKDVYFKLKEGGTVDKELQKTFWSKAYCSMRDRFGIGWQMSFEKGVNG
ncbi:VOC family protein [Acetobacterium bakii]|uniref:Glyoxalase n=1 Tax=Acetobacterium bakii TaxID=52689 RepID=A0A0L6TZD3_9FIRM|nr:VOC family protein [Acetobacterium bakii]KNZ41636.1 glyoxalase [Acetobacterium bakii]